jgi:hypothetical protein
MTFRHWLEQLQDDAISCGCGHRMSGTESAWYHIYLEGVEPSIESIIEWCLSDPDRWADLRQTEPKAA